MGDSIQFRGAVLSGAVSRSPRTIAEHRLLRDGHATAGGFRESARKDTERVLKAQRGFAFLSGGQLEWLDALRPIAQSFQGFERRESLGEDAIGPVTRWFRTNTFFRKPTVSGRIAAAGGELAEFLPKLSGRGIVFLLGPYSFARLVANNHYADPAAMARDYLAALASSCASLAEHGYCAVLFSEPSFGYDLSQNRFEAGRAWPAGCFAAFKDAGLSVGVGFPAADGAKGIPHVEESGADFAAVDAIYTRCERIDTRLDVLFGAVDGTRIGVETEGQILAAAETFRSQARSAGGFYLGPNDRLSDVPFAQGIDKIKALGRAAARLE